MSTDKLDPTQFGIAPYGSDPNAPEFMLIQVPIAHYASQGPDGMDMAWGKVRRIEAMITTAIRNHWEKKRKSNGVVVPSVIGADGKPLKIS